VGDFMHGLYFSRFVGAHMAGLDQSRSLDIRN
jgi:hypothetical protein